MIASLHLFDYEFMRHAFAAGTLAALLSGVVGYFVILRNLSFAAHALGHIGFAGASGALLVAVSPMTGQFILTLLAAMGMGALSKRLNKSDMVIATVLAFCLGLGTLFLHLYQGYAGQASIILFGNLLGVSSYNLYLMFWLMVISLLALALMTKRLLFASLEPELAEAKGVSLSWLSIFFMAILAIAVTLASQVVGIILVFTLLIGPAAIAVQCTRHFWAGIGLSVLLAVVIVWMGIFLSYLTDWPISFWISTLVFFLYIANSARKIRHRV
jgi:zinc/manganese transport system permease protein